jgi:GrpB-like predicted nucleotidyltransferase (UPF0157 family)
MLAREVVTPGPRRICYLLFCICYPVASLRRATARPAMNNSLTIKAYDPQWPIRFEEFRIKLSELLGDLVSAIEHVGSTSVPGLAAKPIIDLDVLLASADYLPETIRRLATLGYEHEGDLGITGREAFRHPPTLFAHHLYVCPPDSEEFRRHILLRNYLRSHPAEVAAYSKL